MPARTTVRDRKPHPFYWVDAFTDEPCAGNPRAVVLDADPLDTATMQRLAFEIGLAETAFVRRSAVATFAARYLTPAEEIPLARHPTISVAWALAESGRLALRGRSTLELRDGPIHVEVRPDNAGAAVAIAMSQRRPEFLGTHDPAAVLPVFGLSPDHMLPGAVI